MNLSYRIHFLSVFLAQDVSPSLFGRFRDLRFVRTAELLAGKLPLQPHEYRDVIQKHCLEARQILLNKSVSGLRMGLHHSVINSLSLPAWRLDSLLTSHSPLPLSLSFHVPSADSLCVSPCPLFFSPHSWSPSAFLKFSL